MSVTQTSTQYYLIEKKNVQLSLEYLLTHRTPTQLLHPEIKINLKPLIMLKHYVNQQLKLIKKNQHSQYTVQK